ncbi:MAG: GNAT family N-acetyltransferase [Armatimonadetes bacterium]|nr:GNAT family N-acetyltransferase [Armatimonadota bacterium]
MNQQNPCDLSYTQVAGGSSPSPPISFLPMSPELPPLTHELTRRLERRVAPHPTDPSGPAYPGEPYVVRFGSTLASRSTSSRPVDKVYCFSAEDLPRLDEILAFYAEENRTPWFYLSPAGFTPEVAAALTARGFAQREFQQAILYGLPRTEAPLLPEGLSLERVTGQNLDAYVTTLADGFEWPAAWRTAAMADCRRSFHPGAAWYLARWEGEPAGCAAVTSWAGIASLAGSAVVPRFRRRGCQTALIQWRLYLATRMNCDLVTGGADFGSASFRNQQRAGLRLAYVESGWTRP